MSEPEMSEFEIVERYLADYHAGRAGKWLQDRTEEDGPIEYVYDTAETRQFVGRDNDDWVYAFNGRDLRSEFFWNGEEEEGAASDHGYESDGAAEDLGEDDVRSVTPFLESEAASDDEQSTAESVDEDNVRSIAESSDEDDVSSYEEDVSSYEEEISDDEVVARPAGGKSRGKTYGGAAIWIPQDQESDDESVAAPSSPPYKPARKAPVSAARPAPKAKPAARKSPAPSSQDASSDGEFYSSIAERRKMMSRRGQPSVVKTKRSYVEDEDEDESEPESDESDFEPSAHVSKKRKVQPAGKTAPVETPSPAHAPARKTVPAQKSAPLKKAAPAKKAAPSRKRKARDDEDEDDDDDDEDVVDRKASTKKSKTQKGQKKERRETVDSDNKITVDINAVAKKDAPKLTEWRNLPGLPDDEDHEDHEGVPGSKWSKYESAALYYCIVDRRNREIDENLVPLRDTNLYKLMSMNIKYSFGVDRTHTACKMHLNRYIKEDKDYDYQGQGSTGATSSQKKKTESQ